MNVKRLILAQYKQIAETEFIWGKTDCLRIACMMAEIKTGRDPGEQLIGTYDSEMSAKRVMVDNNWHDMGDVAASMFEEIHPSQAQVGDWAMILEGNITGLGVVIGWQIVCRHEDGRFGFYSLNAAKRAFRVK